MRRRGLSLVELLLALGNPPPGRRTNRQGFSLAELIIVAIIIGFLAAITIPRFANAASRHRVDAAAKRIIRDLELAQQRAKTSSASLEVRFNKLMNTYRLVGMTDMDRPNNTYIVKLSKEPYKADIISHALGGNNVIIFDGRGNPDTGGSVTIEVGGYQKTIQIDPDTGRASVLEAGNEGST
ncbi:MAG: GspH/FimT family pseudopilin [Planctomycetota bacterium]|jgi:prepilin-type N-terminal cleavage/methylation domain-containing protein